MLPAIRLGRVWTRACLEARGSLAAADMDAEGLLQPPVACPFVLNELVLGEPDARGLVAKLRAALGP